MYSLSRILSKVTLYKKKYRRKHKTDHSTFKKLKFNNQNSKSKFEIKKNDFQKSQNLISNIQN